MIEDGAGKLDKFVLIYLFIPKKKYVTIISRAFNKKNISEDIRLPCVDSSGIIWASSSLLPDLR